MERNYYKSPLEENGVFQNRGFSLAELLPDKKKIFFPFAGGSKVVSLPAGNAK